MLRIVCIALVFAWNINLSFAADSEPVTFATITVENDIIAGVDGGYTNGFAFSWAHAGLNSFADPAVPTWIESLTEGLYISTMPNKKRAISYMVAQGMQTSSDITLPQLIEEEPPYAGLLAWKTTLFAFDSNVSDRLSLVLGIVGPASGAEQAQKVVHKLTGSDEPEGWDNQLENEPVFRIAAERFWRSFHAPVSEGLDFDLMTNVQAGAGTLQSEVGAGLGVRIGNNLAASFATASTLPGREINPLAGTSGSNWYFFIHATSRYVFNSVLIEGNTFERSHGVTLKHAQAIGSYGFALNRGSWGFVISAARSSDQYKGQLESSKFGSFSFTYRF